MISSATLFLATLVFHAAAVLGAPISLSAAEIAPRSLDNSASVRFARDASFPETFPAIVERVVVDSFPIIARETENIVRRYPRRFIHEHLEKRGTTIHEKVTVTEKTIKHDNPIDTVSYNNGHPQNQCGCNGTGGNTCNGNGSSNNGNADPSGGFTTTIAFSTTIHIPGVPTPTATTTTDAPAAPTPTAAAPDAPKPPVAPDAPKPADCNANPAAPTCTKPDTTTPPPAAGNNPSTPANGPKPGGDTTTDGPKPDGTTTTDGPKPDGTNADGPKPDGTATADGSKPTDGTDGAKPTDGAADPAATTPAPAPDASTENGGEGGEGNTESSRRSLKVEAATQPIAKRDLAYSGAAWASSIRRRAL